MSMNIIDIIKLQAEKACFYSYDVIIDCILIDAKYCLMANATNCEATK